MSGPLHNPNDPECPCLSCSTKTLKERTVAVERFRAREWTSGLAGEAVRLAIEPLLRIYCPAGHGPVEWKAWGSCQKCEGTGLHPNALAALRALGVRNPEAVT